MEDQPQAILAQYILDVNEAFSTQAIIKYMGTKVVIYIDQNNSMRYEWPESTCDLVVHDAGGWAPVTGAFSRDGHLYLFVGFGTQGEFLYSPTAPNEYIQVPYGYDPDADGTIHEFFVNPLADDQIARILPLD